FFQTPYVNNGAYYAGQRPAAAWNEDLGSFIRVATWNLEWSMYVDEAIEALTCSNSYTAMIDTGKAPPKSKRYRNMLRQRERITESDIIFLQEMDIGMPRSGYANSVEKMAEALGMNYAYSAQALELEPVVTGVSKLDDKPVDPGAYKGIFGAGILTRFPIKKVEAFQLRHQPYDWYEEEKADLEWIELGRRLGAEILFKEDIQREMKVGGRNYFRIDLEVPGLPNNTLTLINIHLEVKCPPEDREKQVKEILSYIKPIDNPVIMAGDFNSIRHDVSPMTVGRFTVDTATDPSNWVSIGTRVLLSAGAVISAARTGLNTVKNLNNPLAPHVPVLFNNKSKPLFNMIRDFRFDDGGRFDFR
ncbi:MAG: endonuclease/exonuclease/phosphatase family protein, partial [Verrucomicrobiota bacterium]